MSEEIQPLDYLGDDDITVWLERANEYSPMIFPLWPDDYPKHLPVYFSDDGELGVALSRRAMLSARRPSFLWFCRISLGELLAQTDAQASWFKGG